MSPEQACLGKWSGRLELLASHAVSFERYGDDRDLLNAVLKALHFANATSKIDS